MGHIRREFSAAVQTHPHFAQASQVDNRAPGAGRRARNPRETHAKCEAVTHLHQGAYRTARVRQYFPASWLLLRLLSGRLLLGHSGLTGLVLLLQCLLMSLIGLSQVLLMFLLR